MSGTDTHVEECPICGGSEGTIMKVKLGEDRHFFPGREVEELRVHSHKGTDFYIHVIFES